MIIVWGIGARIIYLHTFEICIVSQREEISVPEVIFSTVWSPPGWTIHVTKASNGKGALSNQLYSRYPKRPTLVNLR